MWFNSLRVYRFTKKLALTPEQLADLLNNNLFQPCSKQDSFKLGWVPPLGQHGKSLVHAANGHTMICAKKQERVLPAAVIKEALEEQIRQIQEKEGRSVGRRERQDLKEEIEFELLPKALTKSSLQYAYLAPADNWIVINTGSAKKAEELLSLLRESLGSLSVVPFATKQQPMQAMTQWLETGELPEHFSLGDECELMSLKEEGRAIRCKKQDLSATEVIQHLQTNMLVKRLSIQWQDHIECLLDDELSIKRLKFSEEITDKAAERSPDSAAEEFDIDFNIMTLELRGFLKALTKALGGISQRTRTMDDE